MKKTLASLVIIFLASCSTTEQSTRVTQKPIRIGDGTVTEVIKGSMITVKRSGNSGFTLKNIDCNGGKPIAYMNGVPLNGTVQPGSMIEQAISHACK